MVTVTDLAFVAFVFICGIGTGWMFRATYELGKEEKDV